MCQLRENFSFPTPRCGVSSLTTGAAVVHLWGFTRGAHPHRHPAPRPEWQRGQEPGTPMLTRAESGEGPEEQPRGWVSSGPSPPGFPSSSRPQTRLCRPGGPRAGSVTHPAAEGRRVPPAGAAWSGGRPALPAGAGLVPPRPAPQRPAPPGAAPCAAARRGDRAALAAAAERARGGRAARPGRPVRRSERQQRGRGKSASIHGAQPPPPPQRLPPGAPPLWLRLGIRTCRLLQPAALPRAAGWVPRPGSGEPAGPGRRARAAPVAAAAGEAVGLPQSCEQRSPERLLPGCLRGGVSALRRPRAAEGTGKVFPRVPGGIYRGVSQTASSLPDTVLSGRFLSRRGLSVPALAPLRSLSLPDSGTLTLNLTYKVSACREVSTIANLALWRQSGTEDRSAPGLSPIDHMPGWQ